MKLDVLAIGVHPDDVELGCAGTLVKHKKLGHKVGILDLTRGELGTRGSATLRDKEAAKAAEILEVDMRENLEFADGFFVNDKAHQLSIISVLRKYRPDIVLTNAVRDRHPDHGRASKLSCDACFLSGLQKIETELDGTVQQAWRPKAVYHYIQAYFIEPDFIVDISDTFEVKMESVLAYRSQFHDPDSSEPETFISHPSFLEAVKSRAQLFGKQINVEFGEGFTSERYLGVRHLQDLL